MAGWIVTIDRAVAGCTCQPIVDAGLALAGLALARANTTHLIRAAALAVAAGGAWYLKSWIVTGNPIYPLAFVLGRS